MFRNYYGAAKSRWRWQAATIFVYCPSLSTTPRQALPALLRHLPLGPTSQDRSVIDAVEFVLTNQHSRVNAVPAVRNGSSRSLDLSFVSDAWWPLVTGLKTRTAVLQVDRRMFELCVLFQVANDLKSGDLCIVHSDRFRRGRA